MRRRVSGLLFLHASFGVYVPAACGTRIESYVLLEVYVLIG